MKFSWLSLIPLLLFLLSHLGLPFPELDSVLVTTVLYSFWYFSSELLSPFITPRHERQGKHSCTVKEACLLVRYLAMVVLLSSSRVLLECAYRVVAYGYTSHTILKIVFWNGTPQSRPEHTTLQPRRKSQLWNPQHNKYKLCVYIVCATANQINNKQQTKFTNAEMKSASRFRACFLRYYNYDAPARAKLNW